MGSPVLPGRSITDMRSGQRFRTTGAAADNLLAPLRGQPLRRFSFDWYGQGITLGPRDDVGFMTFPADVAKGPVFRRQLALRVRNFFLGLLLATLRLERRMPGGFIWTGRGRTRRAVPASISRGSGRPTRCGRASCRSTVVRRLWRRARTAGRSSLHRWWLMVRGCLSCTSSPAQAGDVGAAA